MLLQDLGFGNIDFQSVPLIKGINSGKYGLKLMWSPRYNCKTICIEGNLECGSSSPECSVSCVFRRGKGLNELYYLAKD